MARIELFLESMPNVIDEIAVNERRAFHLERQFLHWQGGASTVYTMLRARYKIGRKILGIAAASSFSSSESTIYALATGGVRCALAVIRVSGSQTSTVVERVGGFEKLPEPRRAVYRKLYDPNSNKKSVLDHGILLWFPGPKSYTGEDSCEFHVHGGPAVISSIMRSIGTIPGLRMAEPGEFTKRAFLNGKMDLTEVDGLADLISAETEMQRIQALNQMSGSLGKLYESWRDRIAKCLANAEAYIDFGEDENIEHDILDTIASEIHVLVAEMDRHLSDKRKGERLRNGVHVTILGKPNVGKSSILNILCKREAAIVSQIPGTTRDVIETTVNFHGFPVVFADTAGIRSVPGDVIEEEGIRRALRQARKADLVLLIIDPTNAECLTSGGRTTTDVLVKNELGNLFPQDLDSSDLAEIKEKLFVVINKIDLIQSPSSKERIEFKTTDSISRISCRTDSGMNEFLETLGHRVESLCADPKSEAVYLTHERYRSHLKNCKKHLKSYLESETRDLALKTHNLKNAMNSIGYITGHFGTDDILDILFRDFCIGK